LVYYKGSTSGGSLAFSCSEKRYNIEVSSSVTRIISVKNISVTVSQTEKINTR